MYSVLIRSGYEKKGVIVRLTGRVTVRECEKAVFVFKCSNIIEGLEEYLIDDMIKTWWAVAAAQTGIRISHMRLEVGALKIFTVPTNGKEHLETESVQAIRIQIGLVRKKMAI